MSELISAVVFTVLKFPLSHFISGWTQIRESWYLITLVKTEGSLLGVGEGTPYGTNIIEDYFVAVELASTICGNDLEDAIRVVKEVEYKALSCNRRVTYGAFLSVEGVLLDALSKYKKCRLPDCLVTNIGIAFQWLVRSFSNIHVKWLRKQINGFRGELST